MPCCGTTVCCFPKVSKAVYVLSVPEMPGHIVLLKLSRPCFYCLVEMKMRAPNRICGFPLIRQRSGGCWNTSFKVLHMVETGDPLGNVNVAVPHYHTDIASTCWWHGIKLLVAATALEFRHQGSETFVCPLAGTQRSNCQVDLTSNLSVT